MTFLIERSYSFDSAHRLIGHSGKCSRLHGHTYKVEVALTASRLIEPEEGESDASMVKDFGDLDAVVKPLIDAMDHHFIVAEDELDLYTELFDQMSFGLGLVESLHALPIPRTTAEELARYFAQEVHLAFRGVFGVGAAVYETPKSKAEYFEPSMENQAVGL